MTNFLPEGYENLKATTAYWKMSQMKEGDNRFRIVMKPIAGWLDWMDKKPIRFRPEERPKKSFDPEKPARAFWACYVWDYEREGLFILEITQSSVLKGLTMFAEDNDWGDFTKYDFKLKKEGNGKETRYTLTPMPHKPLSPAIEEAIKASPVRLEALYDGGNPWADMDGTQAAPLKYSPPTEPMDRLKEELELDGIPTQYLMDYLQALALKKKKPVAECIQSALLPEVMPQFKALYLKELAKQPLQTQLA